VLRSDDPAYLRKRAEDLRTVLRSVGDEKAADVLKGFIAELEAKADRLTDERQLRSPEKSARR